MPSSNIPDMWQLPKSSYIKLNFNGSSKGDPIPASIGGDSILTNGKILCIYARSIEHNTNNVADLLSLMKGLQIETTHKFTKLMIEGELMIVIQLFNDSGSIAN